MGVPVLTGTESKKGKDEKKKGLKRGLTRSRDWALPSFSRIRRGDVQEEKRVRSEGNFWSKKTRKDPLTGGRKAALPTRM